MVALSPDERIPRFEAIFKAPTIEAMLALTSEDFERFVQYVFECAGYPVKYVAKEPFPGGPGFDLNLHGGGAQAKAVAGVEVKRFTPPQLVPLKDVAAFIGIMNVNGDLPGYMVTSNEFSQAGYAAAKATNGRVHLINGDHLLRYIAYVSGSRLTGPNAPKSQPVRRIPPTYLFEADAIERLSPRSTTVLAVANNKGGVAKTTTAANVGLALADQFQKRVLLIDMDGQGSLSRLLPLPGPPPPALPPPDVAFLSDYFTRRAKLGQLVRPARFERVWVIPAHQDLFLLDKGGGGHPQDELAFVRALHDPALVAPDGQPFDWIILDTPPAQSFFTRAALAASHYVLLPANAETLAVLGASRALRTASTMRALMGGGAQILGGLVARLKQTAEAQKAVIALTDLLRGEGTRLLPIAIPEDPKVERSIGRTVGGWLTDLFHISAQASPAAKAYGNLVKEQLPHVRNG